MPVPEHIAKVLLRLEAEAKAEAKAEAETEQRQEFIAWLKLHGMYDTVESVQTMQKLHRLYFKLVPALTMLEKVLGDFEPLADQLDPDTFQEFRSICAATADLRDGTDV